MKFGITVKLFLAIFATCMLVVITMHLGIRLSFEHGFIDYIKNENEQRVLQLRETLEDQYQQYGNWDFLRNRDRGMFRMRRPMVQNGEESLQSWHTRLWVFDQQKNKLIGSPMTPPEDSQWQPLTIKNQTIGWIVAAPLERLTRNADISFDHQQQRTSWLIVGLSTLLAIIVTWLMSRGLLAPVKRLVNGIHRLAAGNFSARVMVTSRDELGMLAQDFNHLAAALEKNEQSRRDFMADVSHELRTPLAILQGELEALQDGIRQPSADSFRSLQAEVAVLTKLVDDVHQLSLSDLGTLSYRKKPIDMVKLLQVSVASFADRLQHKQITLVTHFPTEAWIFGDPHRLSQLFNNLLENSLRYTDNGGQLHVDAEITREQLLIRWQDSSPGVTDEQLSLIFERFYRADSSRNRASGGSGLGLAICANIVEAHGGHLYAEHSPLGGLLMTIKLPLHAAM
ncbi:two-component system sensor histidine kinase BaeS [Pectobacteriaceae bacterium C52]|nr:two-component system sensor histidine kinase BaeS [Pectobacteriaceae bacterium C52]